MADSKQCPRGAFIVIEGLDRSGKSTQVDLLARALNESGRGSGSVYATTVKYPERSSPTGRVINSFLTGAIDLEPHAAHLLFVANRWEEDERIRRRLAEGWTVIADRYVYSGAAYAAARGLEVGWCAAPEAGLVAPDLVMYLAAPPEVAERRTGYGDERFEKRELQAAADVSFKIMAAAGGRTWRVVDASGTPAQVHERVLGVARAAIGRVASGEPLRVLGTDLQAEV